MIKEKEKKINRIWFYWLIVALKIMINYFGHDESKSLAKAKVLENL